MAEISSQRKKIKLQYVPLAIAGIFSWLYMIGGPSFSEIHINLSFLDFPVFIGEIALAVCLALCALVVKIRKDTLRPAYLWLAVYMGFVLIKTWVGYQKYGPLACRHAALFYYPLFAVVTSRCADKRLFRNTIFKLGIIALGFLAFYSGVYSYFAFPLTLIVFGAILSLPHATWRTLVFTVLLLVLPYGSYFDDGRSRIAGNALGFITLVGLSVVTFIRMRKRLKAAAIIGFTVLLTVVVLRVADRNAVRSLTSLNVMWEKWKKCSGIIGQEYERHEFKEVEARIFNQDRKELLSFKDEVKEVFHRRSPPLLVNQVVPQEADGTEILTEKPVPLGSFFMSPEPGSVKLRSLETARNNILFRIFIWRDVWRDMWAKRCFLIGSDFGFPFRSRSLEILGWADDAWGVDGWVAVHNSYIDMIYRGGVVGLGLVIYLATTLLRLIKLSVQDRKSTYIFTVSVFVCWLTYANFIEFFELPYTAIPFWVLWGVAVAGLGPKRKKSEEGSASA